MVNIINLLDKKFYHWPAFFIFVVALSISTIIYDDYGIGWDEQQQRGVGFVTLNYIEHNDPYLFEFQDRDYGVAIELPLMFVEKLFQIEDSRQVYLTRHAILHGFFLLAAMSLYFLTHGLFKNRWLAVFALLALLLHPRIYAHSFFNSKDIPFLSLYLICFSVFFWADQSQRKILAYVILGILTGLLCNLRIMGIMFLASIIGYLVICIPLKKLSIPFQLKLIFVYLCSSLLSLYLSFPYLWEAPILHFMEIFQNMAKFRWQGEVLLAGELISHHSVPWYYFSLWFISTTPLLLLVLGLWGGLSLIIHNYHSPLKLFRQPEDYHPLLYLLTFLGGATAVILFDSVLYNGWRQLFFLYPAFVLLASYGLYRLYLRISSNKLKIVLIGGVLLQFSLLTLFSWLNHPFQHLYFNPLVNQSPAALAKNYEYDYWGTSYKMALELILAYDQRKQIKVNVANWPGILNTQILSAEAQKRLEVDTHTSMADADYFISNNLVEPNKEKNKLLYSHMIQNSAVFRIWQAQK